MEEQVASEETADKVDGAQVQKEERVRLHHGTDLGGPAEPGQAPEDLPAPAGSNPEEGFVILDQNGQPLHCERMVIVTGQSENGELYVIPSNHVAASQVLLPHGQLLDISETGGAAVPCSEKADQEALQTVSSDGLSNGSAACKLKGACGSFVVPLKPLPPNAPSWALRLRDCEKIGDSYRGYCSTEAELEAVLLLHKQQTHAVFGTRQSPSPAKPATRLMWKSQYVPYDGIPFVNAGSRAIVMECQFGPRRKGLQPKKMSEQENSQHYKATCPARIYIKKVWKFPEYRVPTDPKVDKKVVRQEQEKAFFNLKKSLVDVGGVLRYYVQLPTQKAHLYHDMDTPILPPPPLPFPEDTPPVAKEEEEADGEGTEEESTEDGACVPSRLHPRVAEKIQELVAQGHGQVYTVRKQLRRFVEREMFKAEKVPERHNLCYFPTVNDIKNHIHEAQKALQLGGLDTTGPAVDTQWKAASDDLLTETVTLTLTPAPVEAGPHKVGVLEGAETLSPDAAQLFSSLASLQPKIFAQLQGVQLQPSPCPVEGAPELLDACSPLLLGPAGFLPPCAALADGLALSESSTQLVSVSTMVDRTHQILLEDGQAIPVQIVQPSAIALARPGDATQVKVEAEDTPIRPGPADD